MAPYRILLIHSGHGFSTADIYTGVKAGFEACGVQVIPFRLDETLRFAGAILDIADEAGMFADPAKPETAPLPGKPDIYQMAGMGIPAMAMHHQVNAVVAITGSSIAYTLMHTLYRGGIKRALICTESPYTTTTREQYDAWWYDVVFTNERKAIPLFTKNKPGTVHYLPHAYNPAVHTPGDVEKDKQCDAFFVGTAFPERRALFDGVNWDGIRLVNRGTLWDGDEDTKARLSRLVENTDVVRWYRSAAININHHRTTGQYGDGSSIQPGDAESLGPRAYEIAACGGFQLMDDSRPEAREVFSDSLATYRSGDSADLERQLRYYLSHPDERKRLALAQHEAVLPHTWTARAQSILDVLLA